MSDSESGYKRFTWLVIGTVATVSLGGAAAVVTQAQQVAQLRESLNELKDAIAAMQQDLRSMATHGETLQREAARNAEQEKQITELRIWRAQMEARLTSKP